MAEAPRWLDETLSRQLAMSRALWAVLQEHGLDESASLPVDFFYEAPDEAGAQSLAAFLSSQTDYDVNVKMIRKGMLSRKRWSVAGSTQPMTLSLDILDRWVRWMVMAGAQNGGCEFDGWGAQLP